VFKLATVSTIMAAVMEVGGGRQDVIIGFADVTKAADVTNAVGSGGATAAAAVAGCGCGGLMSRGGELELLFEMSGGEGRWEGGEDDGCDGRSCCCC